VYVTLFDFVKKNVRFVTNFFQAWRALIANKILLEFKTAINLGYTKEGAKKSPLGRERANLFFQEENRGDGRIMALAWIYVQFIFMISVIRFYYDVRENAWAMAVCHTRLRAGLPSG
jgi:hypothetical protein